MGSLKSIDRPAIDELINAMQLICSSMNIGLMVHHMEGFGKTDSIRFIYANDEASKYTATDLSKLVGKTLPEAFPELTKTEIPETFLEVALKKEARNIGVMEYQDENVRKAFFAVKAFPLPNDCVGVAFENVTNRKQLENMIKDYTSKLRRKNAQLEKLSARTYNEVAVPLRKLHSRAEELSSKCGDLLPEEQLNGLYDITEGLRHLILFIEEQITSTRAKK